MKKTTRIVIETKSGFRFGYEKVVEKPDLKELKEPKPLRPYKRIDIKV